MLRHQKADPSNEKDSHRWKWTNRPICTKMLQKTKIRYATELLYFVSFMLIFRLSSVGPKVRSFVYFFLNTL